jgi:hypothetical protein
LPASHHYNISALVCIIFILTLFVTLATLLAVLLAVLTIIHLRWWVAFVLDLFDSRSLWS